ncbi:response regulator [Saccharophagus degradans]|uniref:hybrid sensor histidine kinase/response regulator n=1 Tax=Saccharophagus degradans TaxID=86304 RepID=UPI001C085844|nr:hybrid sensor histidine kinase/response regulator [Saccharophagus degradans]MBU2985335.1 response regulator [Saccharophagus degradans]
MQILLIEDNPDHAELVQETLHSAYPKNADIHWVDRLSPGLEKLKNNNYDLFLCDLKLPDSTIETTVSALQNIQTFTPIVVLTSLDDEGIAKLLINTGVQDYIPKENLDPDFLQRVCNHSIERKKQTVELENRNADQARFCFSLCHDFKEPIRKISTMLSMLRTDIEPKIELTEENQWCFDSVQKNATSLISLIDGLYEYLSLESGEITFTSINLNHLVLQIKSQFLEDNTTASISHDDLPVIEGIESQILFLIKNIIHNGIKYNARAPQINIRHKLDANKKYCHLFIQDNGIGLKEEHFEEIFSPFKRLHSKSKYPGTGLGLSIAKRVVESHRGKISIESELGLGTTFKITLPLKQNIV